MKKGFTLIELVLVAAIIALITSLVLSRLDVSREKGRDTKKVSELKALQTAIELYQLDIGRYLQQQPSTEVAKNGGAGFSSMSTLLQPIVDAGYLSAIPVPPKGSAVSGGDVYYYQTSDTNDSKPRCNGRTLADVPYIIYFVTEQPRNLPRLENLNTSGNMASITNGYCLTL